MSIQSTESLGELNLCLAVLNCSDGGFMDVTVTRALWQLCKVSRVPACV